LSPVAPANDRRRDRVDAERCAGSAAM
jgi:hypothetical protein